MARFDGGKSHKGKDFLVSRRGPPIVLERGLEIDLT